MRYKGTTFYAAMEASVPASPFFQDGVLLLTHIDGDAVFTGWMGDAPFLERIEGSADLSGWTGHAPKLKVANSTWKAHHGEHLRKADETYEIRHDNAGHAVHVVIKDGEAIFYPSIHDLVNHHYFGQNSERFYVSEDDINILYDSEKYDYYDLRKIAFNIDID